MAKLLAPNSRILVQVWSYEQDSREGSNPYLKNEEITTTRSHQPREHVNVSQHLILPVHINRTPFVEQDLLVPFQKKSSIANKEVHPSKTSERELRYYHVFREGELDHLFTQIECLEIEKSYYDKGNWCVIGMKKTQVT